MATNTELVGLGLLTLDEPTEFLDQIARTAMLDALERLRELTQTSGLQVLCVTHDASLQSAFDSTIVFHGVGQLQVR